MINFMAHLEEELAESLGKLSSADFSDEGISGIHLVGKPRLLRGTRVDPQEKQNVLRDINRHFDSKPLSVKLRDRKTLKVQAIDLVITPSSLVYLADILDGEIV